MKLLKGYPSVRQLIIKERKVANHSMSERSYRVQTAPRPLLARCETFDNQRKDVKPKQHLLNFLVDGREAHFGQKG
jgi:hypothetical protein